MTGVISGKQCFICVLSDRLHHDKWMTYVFSMVSGSSFPQWFVNDLCSLCGIWFVTYILWDIGVCPQRYLNDVCVLYGKWFVIRIFLSGTWMTFVLLMVIWSSPPYSQTLVCVLSDTRMACAFSVLSGSSSPYFHSGTRMTYVFSVVIGSSPLYCQTLACVVSGK